MFDRLELSLAWQFLTHSANGFARFVTWVSFLGLALGVMILTLVVTVMNGFDYELKTRLLASLPHVTVSEDEADERLQNIAMQHDDVLGVARYFQGLGAIVARNRVHPVSVYAIQPEGSHHLFAGQAEEAIKTLLTNKHAIVLGTPLARALGVRVGDRVPLITARVDEDMVAPTVLNFELVGTFELGAEPDYNLVILNLAKFDAAAWTAMGELGHRLQLNDPLQAQQVIEDLQIDLPEVTFTSWQSQYGELFRAVQLEKSMMFVLLFLVVAIAAFNIIAGQSMLVNEKRRSIAILVTMGCNDKIIRRVFLLQGTMISVAGTALGLALGVWVSSYVNELLGIIESVSGMHLLDGSLFVEVPVLVMTSDLLFIASICLVLCWAASWMPASRAAAIDPVNALH